MQNQATLLSMHWACDFYSTRNFGIQVSRDALYYLDKRPVPMCNQGTGGVTELCYQYWFLRDILDFLQQISA